MFSFSNIEEFRVELKEHVMSGKTNISIKINLHPQEQDLYNAANKQLGIEYEEYVKMRDEVIEEVFNSKEDSQEMKRRRQIHCDKGFSVE